MTANILDASIELRKFVNTWADGAPYSVDPEEVTVDECWKMLADAMDVFGLEIRLVDSDSDDA